MRIAIDCCTWDNRRGYGRFTRELVTAIVTQNDQSDDFHLLCDSQTKLPQAVLERAKVERVSTKQRPIAAARSGGARSIRDMLRVTAAIHRLRPDVVFFPTPFTYVWVPDRVPVVLTLHDAMTERNPGWFFDSWRARCKWRLKLRLALCQAQRVVAPTESAADAIANTFALLREEIVAIGEAPAADFYPRNDELARRRLRARLGLNPDRPVILYVGGLSPHKNVPALLEALAGIDLPWQLAMVGDSDWDGYLTIDPPLSRVVSSLGLDQQVVCTGYLSDDDLALLYSDSLFLALPSFDEGFGLPVAEAFACGTPAALSHCGALPEVAGDAALYFDPYDIEDIRRVCRRYIEEPQLRTLLSNRALQRARVWRWEIVAERAMNVILSTNRGTRAARPDRQ